MKIGMTGGIGSGKNAAAAIFEELGFHTIDMDKVSRLVMSPSGGAYLPVIKAFGKGIADCRGNIDREKLGEIVFSDTLKRKELEDIVHPEVFKEEKKIRGVIKNKDDKALIITHAALMLESGSYKNYDMLITVHASEAIRIKRVAMRDGVSEEKAMKIIASQASEDERLKIAHIIINNSGDMENLRKETCRAADLIKQIAYGLRHS